MIDFFLLTAKARREEERRKREERRERERVTRSAFTCVRHDPGPLCQRLILTRRYSRAWRRSTRRSFV